MVLGSTGSIGTNCLDVIRSHREDMRLTGATAFRSVDQLIEQAAEFRPNWVAIADEQTGKAVSRQQLPPETEFIVGMDSIRDLVRRDEVDTVVSAIVGAAGLPATWEAVDAGKKLAVANKEALVVAGDLITGRARQTGAPILPVDSEHSAVFQALQAGRIQDLRRIVLTASGGPFRGWTREQMKSVTPQMALRHPTWEMGPKITVDSATMMNKALEIIEARWLFDVSPEQISVVIHPQSIIHSFVEYRDGSVISQMSPPDMRLPIQYALTFPDRLECPCPDTDWSQSMSLELFPPDLEAFPALQLGFEVAERGGTSGVVLNASNEIAVSRFLEGQIRFDQITQLCREILNHHTYDAHPTLEVLQQLDTWAREESTRWNP